MSRLLPLVLLCSALLLGPSVARAEPGDARVHHDIAATVDPAKHHIDVVDEIGFPGGVAAVQPEGGGKTLAFRLHAGLAVEVLGGDFTLAPTEAAPAKGATGSGEEGKGHALRTKLHRLTLKEGAGDKPTLKLRLVGLIDHPLQAESEEYARSFARTPGTICDEGVFLGGASWWLPRFGDELVTFDLAVTLPAGWVAVSQGAAGAAPEGGGNVSRWSCKHPMDEVYLIANRFHAYERSAGSVTAQAFLRSADETLANKYLEVTAQYIDMYRKLIGPYPYEKFALIENFWETGYGMPSFTLLGPRVIRFPFILHSSYPHEILHNWWGNSVYVDWQTGNWCEGLTAYLADHLVREGQGRGVEYRQDTLKSYRNYVKAGKDFPLTQFRSRHSSATQAVGYGKCLMLCHMLRRRVGDATFARGLQHFYRQNKWRRAAFADLRAAFESVAGEDLGWFFSQWVERTGAPDLAIKEVTSTDDEVRLVLQQRQEGEAYRLRVPVAITMEGSDEATVVVLDMTEKEQAWPFAASPAIRRFDVDPQFDVFRRLHRAEIPPTMSQMFGAERVMIITPKEAARGVDWTPLTEAWARGPEGKIVVASEDQVEALPPDRAVWVLGENNAWGKALRPYMLARGAQVGAERLTFGRSHLPNAGHSFVFTAAHPEDPELAVGWIGTSAPAAVAGLARKLPHYGKYSYLGFQGDAPDNVEKGRWAVADSPLSHVLVQGAAPGTLAARQPLTRLAPVFDPQTLMKHVTWLADPAREGRGVGTKGLDASADYIAAAMKAAGLQPGGDGDSFFQSFEAPNGPDGRPVTLKNVVGILPGTNPVLAPQSVVLGAHYDHLGLGWPDHRAEVKGEIYNGADDNASGIAVLLELARLLGKQHKPSRSIVFVAFSGEEWGLKGSGYYVKHTKHHPAAEAIAMVNMDTVGRLHGKKIQVLGAGTATEWRHIAMGVGFTTGVESACIADDPGGSDQQSFVRVGVPGVQIFSGAHADYHRPTDDVEKIDAAGLVKVATFVREVIVYLGERPGRLTSMIQSGGGGPPPDRPTAGRRVSLGTMPAFDYRGPGVKVASVIQGSPAEAAGIQPGDILREIDGETLTDLRTFSRVLGKHAPGDVVKIRLNRRGDQHVVEATLKAR